MAAEDAALVERAKALVADVRGLTIGDERLDVLTQLAAEKAEAKEKADAARAAKESKAAKAAAEALGISQPSSVAALVSSIEDEDPLRSFVLKLGEKNGQGHPTWNPSGHHTGGLAIRLFDLKCGDQKCEELCALLPMAAERLSSLSLFGNDISAAGGRALLQVLPQLSRLKYLDVQGNRLGADMIAKLKASAPAGCKLESKTPGPTGDGPCCTQVDWESAPRVLGTRLVDAVHDLTRPAGSSAAPPGWPGPPPCICSAPGDREFQKCKYCVKAFVKRIREQNPRWPDTEVNFRTVRKALQSIPEEAIPPARPAQKSTVATAKTAGVEAKGAKSSGRTGSADQLHVMAPTCVHVGGLEGTLEEEDALTEVFSQFGTLLAVTVRIRREGKKVSWALVSYGSAQEADRCLAGTAALTSKYPGIVARRVDEEQALQSKGAMGQVMSRHIQTRLGKMLAVTAAQ